jgi:hypothetical protein
VCPRADAELEPTAETIFGVFLRGGKPWFHDDARGIIPEVERTTG